ncbi:hypothetical protein AB434_2471 [Heyndrickxia coagulans]|nr:hypothetical protein SB48_HM08orf04520 [Heyndrickxia coagulans]AKN54876.1 hypothetical protein AB434_2471 [Heyndrickxia coagulans]
MQREKRHVRCKMAWYAVWNVLLGGQKEKRGDNHFENV